ncbi:MULTISPECIES: methanobactin [Komagataeibacter]
MKITVLSRREIKVSTMAGSICGPGTVCGGYN